MEWIEIYDENNCATGIQKEKEQAHKEGNFHRTAHVWIINDKQELLLQKRSANKKSHPNCWDISGAGHIKAGEQVLEGAIRELQEELGIIVHRKSELAYITTIKSTKSSTNREFQYVYYKELEKMVKEKAEGLLPHEEEYLKLFEYIRKNIET